MDPRERRREEGRQGNEMEGKVIGGMEGKKLSEIVQEYLARLKKIINPSAKEPANCLTPRLK